MAASVHLATGNNSSFKTQFGTGGNQASILIRCETVQLSTRRLVESENSFVKTTKTLLEICKQNILKTF